VPAFGWLKSDQTIKKTSATVSTRAIFF